MALVLRPGLETAGDAAAVHDRAIGERAGAWVVLEREVEELVAAGFFEPSVANLDDWASSRARPRAARYATAPRRILEVAPLLRAGSARALDEIRLVDDRKPFSQVGVVRQMAVAVSDREDRRHQLEAGCGGGRLDLFDVPEVIVRHPVQDLKLVVGEQDPGVSAALGPIEKRPEVVDRAVDLQVEAAIEPALGIGRRRPARSSAARARGHGARQTRKRRPRSPSRAAGGSGRSWGSPARAQPMRPVM